MNNFTRRRSMALPNLLMVLAMTLGLALLAGSCAEDGVEGDDEVVVDRDIFWTEVETIILDAGCQDNCHLPNAPIATYCDSCHGGDGYTPNTISTLDELGMIGVASSAVDTGPPNIVEAGDSGSSTLWWAISGDAQYDGGMKSYMTTLTANEKGIIKAWIDQGANP